MNCLAEERFVELLETGGLEATSPGEQAHLDTCAACRDTWATVAATGEMLAEARPRSPSGAGRWIPLLAAAGMLIAILLVIATRPTPAHDPVAVFLDGPAEERAAARVEILTAGRKAIPGLVAARSRFQGSPRFKELQALLWDLKTASLRQDPEDVAVLRKLETMKIDLAFGATRGEDILNLIRDFSGLNLVLDPTVQPGSVNAFKVENQTLREVLEIFCSVTGLDFDFRYKVLLFSTPMRIWSTDPKVGLPIGNVWRTQVPEADPLVEKLHSIRLSIGVLQQPNSALCDYLNEVGALNIKADASIAGELLTIEVKDLTVDHFLEVVTLLRGWDLRIEGGGLLIFKPAK